MGKGRIATALLAGLVLVLGAGPSLNPLATNRVQPAQLLAAPIPGTPGELHVTAAGDYSSSAAAAGVISRVGTIAPDLHLALGDLTYGATGAEQAWCDFVTSRTGAGFPFELISGNHESNGLNGNINDIAACLPNQLPGAVGSYGRQYYVDVPQQNPLVRFVMIAPGIPFSDGTWDFSVGSPRYNWTAAAIDGARAASIPWVVAGMHTPCLSVGQYGCTAGAPLTNLLVSKKVDLVLNGHEHLYQRTKQLATSANCSGLVPDVYNPACVADVDNSLGKGAGTVFTTVGTGGVDLRDVNAADSEAPYFAASSGLNSNPSNGLLDLKFTATSMTAGFVATSGTFQDGFSIAPTGANVPPTAAFTSSCTGLACTFDGAASNDPGGSIVSYAWDFGDSTSSTSQPAGRTYLAPGTYPVTLTVTDNAGSTGTVVHNVNVTDPVTGLLAQDTFERTVSNGLGAAATGGTWTATGSAANYSVAAGTGRIRIPAAGGGLNSYLGTVASSNTELYLELATDKAATGSSIYLSGIGRRIAAAGEYRAKLSLAVNGSVALSLIRTTANGTETTIQSAVTVAGLNYAVGDKLALRLQVTGTSPTTVRARVWELGSAEPTTWQRSITDATAALQGTGGIGLATYLSSTASNAPLTVLMDNLKATAP